MNIFAVIKVGVYIQAVISIHSTVELAKSAREIYKSKEKDKYHNFDIEERALDEVPNIFFEEDDDINPEYAYTVIQDH